MFWTVVHYFAVHSQARIPRKQRHTQRGLVHEALVVPTVLTEEEAIVGAVEDERVISLFRVLEELQYSRQILIHAVSRAVIILHEALEDPLLAV